MTIKEILDGYNENVIFENSIGIFDVPVYRVKYTMLRKKYSELAREAYNRYASDWNSYVDCGKFLRMENSRFQKYLEKPIKEVISDLMSMGIFDVDLNSIMNYADSTGYFAEYQEIYDAFIQRVNQINGQLEYEKAQREYRKENRARWVGGTIGTSSNYIKSYMHQSELAMRNMAEGAGHSVVNAFGNMMSTANANAQINSLFTDEDVRETFNEGVLIAVWSMHFVVMDFLYERANINAWDIPSQEDKSKAERLLNNIDNAMLDEANRKKLVLEAFTLNPYSKYLYLTLLKYYTDDTQSIIEIAEYFGVDLKSDFEQMACDLIKRKKGTTEESAKRAKEELLKFYDKYGITDYEKSEAYEYINKLLYDFDLAYRTVDNIVFDTRDEADFAKRELYGIQNFMKHLKAPTKDDTLEYEEELKAKRQEFDNMFSSKLKDKYLAQIDKMLLDFDRIFCTISLFKKGTRKEAAKAKAVNFLKKQDTSTKEKREEALERLREYLPKIGLLEEEATEAMDYLKQKEVEEYCGKESSFSKLSKGLGGLFKK